MNEIVLRNPRNKRTISFVPYYSWVFDDYIRENYVEENFFSFATKAALWCRDALATAFTVLAYFLKFAAFLFAKDFSSFLNELHLIFEGF